MMSVPVEVGRSFRAGQPRALFDDVFASPAGGFASYDVTGDGRRFLMVEELGEPPPPHIVLIPDLPKEVRDEEQSRRR